ncbi:hypothetical protein [Paenibacillus sp. LHD-38]|uniref:hypothetical protein n=1 Tax=Paenibacillus sp. LHD-38 TaxID=3072143 RepID=UPI00280C6523|nr:hypothetical protein [Paenibacillus sp. LHD-38]MDQ8739080.1 hypothetical protein [Paenibacillus sp. LHD-38]
MQGENIYLLPMAVGHAEELLALRLRNYHFFKPFEPIRPEPSSGCHAKKPTLYSGIGERRFSS